MSRDAPPAAVGVTAWSADPAWVWGPPVVALALAALILVTRSNAALFVLVNHAGPWLGDRPWAVITVLGDTAVAAALLLPFVHRRPDVLWAMTLAALLAVLWVHGLKPWLALPRPPRVFPADALHIIGPAHRSRTFPSGHTATAFTLAGVLVLGTVSRGLRWVLVLAASAVGLSRIAVGVHWPLDVVAGALGGWLAAAGGVWTARYWSWGLRPAAQRPLAALLLVNALGLLVSYDSGYPQARPFQQALAAVCLIAGAPGLVVLFRPQRRAG